MSYRFAVALATLAVGCTAPGSENLGVITQPLACPIWQCGSNSPEIDGYGFHELNEQGLLNREGFWIEGFEKNGVAYRADVTNGRLRGIDDAGEEVLSGTSLAGAQLRVRHNSGLRYLVRVTAVTTAQPFWAKLAHHPTLETYLLEWIRTHDGVHPAPRHHWRNVCSKAVADDTNPELLGMWGEHTVLFEGERIEAEPKLIEDEIDESWFNLGCAGHALAKLYLTGHTHAAQSAGFATSIGERQAMLKMFAADYCGTGFPFTVAGVALSWKDEYGWMKHSSRSVTLEARWSKDGPTCLETPRADANPTVESLSVFPSGVEAAIEEMCGRPQRCSELDEPNEDPHDLAGSHVVSANPP